MNNIDRFFNEDVSQFSENYIQYVSEVIKNINIENIKKFIEILLEAKQKKSTVYFIGNGGSASTASHFANDLAIGTNSWKNPLKVISLVDNNAIMTAIANDYGFEEVFLRQVKIYCKKDDVLVAISASGNSGNLLSSIKFANSFGINTVALTSFDGGQLKNLAKHCIHVPTELKEYGPAEDAHLIINHLVMSYLKRHFENEENKWPVNYGKISCQRKPFITQ